MDLPDSLPGCMGRMIGLFDLSAGMTKTKLLTEKPHMDGNFSCFFILNYNFFSSLFGCSWSSHQHIQTTIGVLDSFRCWCHHIMLLRSFVADFVPLNYFPFLYDCLRVELITYLICSLMMLIYYTCSIFQLLLDLQLVGIVLMRS